MESTRTVSIHDQLRSACSASSALSARNTLTHYSSDSYPNSCSNFHLQRDRKAATADAQLQATRKLNQRTSGPSLLRLPCAVDIVDVSFNLLVILIEIRLVKFLR